MTRILLLVFAALITPSAASAQSGRASATLTVESPLTVAASAPVRLKTTVLTQGDGEAGSAADAQTVIMVGGDPERVYRVRVPGLPSAAGADIRIVSDNSGDISGSGLSRLDAEGRDRLHITGLSGLLTVSETAASFPLSLVYE